MKKSNLTKKEKIFIFLIRWWSIGAVYFFIGWGTRLGSYNTSIDFVLMLGISIGLFNTFVVHTALRMLFNIEKYKEYGETTMMEKVSYRLRNVISSIVIVYLVTLIYININEIAIRLFDLNPEAVVLGGEPILFALFYMGIYTLFTQLINNVKSRSRQNELS